MVRLRLAANKGSGSYALVATEAKNRRDGKRAAKLGDYNPRLPVDNPFRLVMKFDEALNWIENGAQPSDRFARLMKKYSQENGKTMSPKVAALIDKCCVFKPAKAAGTETK